jgi:hypothetical protein
MADAFVTGHEILRNVKIEDENNELALKLLTRLNALDIAEMLGLK